MDHILLDRTCRLAELELDESEKENMLKDLENMVTLFETISELDTEGVAPLSGVLEEGGNVLREDVVNSSTKRGELLANAPAMQDGLFVVPKTFS
ncbi:MAG: Asp-tRNA(Asn)/Glu-tRNA(Gln) amidotransferase subunit GatC [Acetatifactor sp.]|nr:Asp-tRNA(Asn)/Glu-tRNA(Gln) amidotransferase subunit GatC [Acetatifactor sp.]